MIMNDLDLITSLTKINFQLQFQSIVIFRYQYILALQQKVCNTILNTNQGILSSRTKFRKTARYMVTSLEQFLMTAKLIYKVFPKQFSKEGRSLRKLIKKVLQQEFPHCQKGKPTRHFVLHNKLLSHVAKWTLLFMLS